MQQFFENIFLLRKHVDPTNCRLTKEGLKKSQWEGKEMGKGWYYLWIAE